MINLENEQKELQPPQKTEKPAQFQPEKSPSEIMNERIFQINIEEIQKVSQEKDARELARAKSELEQLTNDEYISPYQLSKEQIIEKCKNSIITPEKPSLRKIIK